MARYSVRPQINDAGERLFAVHDGRTAVAVYTREQLACIACDRLEQGHVRRLTRLAAERIEQMRAHRTAVRS